MMAEGKPGPKESGGLQYRVELIGFKGGSDRPQLVVQAVDRENAVVHSEKVAPDGTFSLPADVLRSAHQIILGSPDASGAVPGNASVRYRASEFASAVKDGRLALAEGMWSRFVFVLECVSGNVKVCRRRPWWFDKVVAMASRPAFEIQTMSRSLGSLVASRIGEPSLSELLIWPYRCSPICLGTVEVYRRSCCCWPIIVDEWRIPDLIRDLEIIVDLLPKGPHPKGPFPPPPSPPIDPLATPIFKGGALNELALNASNDLAALTSMPRDHAAQYISSRPYLHRKFCSCGAPDKVATGTIQPDGTFNICWGEPHRLSRPNCHDEYAYIVKQTLGGTTTTIYDGITAGIWFHAGDHAELTSYNGLAFSCNDTGPGDGTAYVYLDLIGDTESHELTTPASTGWDRVAAPATTSGLLFPNAAGNNGYRNLGGSVELTFNFSEGMKAAAIGARYYRVSISRADAAGNPVGPRHYCGDGLTWQKAVINGMDVDIVPETLGPVPIGTENYLYRIPFDSDENWTGSVRHHASINTLLLNVPPLSGDAPNHLVTLEVFNAAGERLRPAGVPASGQPGTEVVKGFKFRRWFQPGGSVGNDTVEVPFAALTHLFCWDNRPPVADIERLVEGTVPSSEECQFLEAPGSETFGIEYRAYVPDQRFQWKHAIGWIRGLNGSAANGGVGTLPTPLSPANVGEPPAAAANSGTNTFELMLTRLQPPADPVVLERCAFAVTLTTWSKTTDGSNLGFPLVSEQAAFALQIETPPTP